MPDAQTPSAIVFDFGGVLMDWNPRHLYRKLFDDPEEMERFFEEIGFDVWNLEQDRGRPFSEGVAVLSRQFPHRAELIAAFHERWEETITGPIEETVQILAELKELGYPLYGLSNWSAETFALVRPRNSFFDWFDLIVLSGEERVTKPDREIFDILLARAGRSAEECLFIDDSATNIAGAEALGFQVHRFSAPGVLREDLVAR